MTNLEDIKQKKVTVNINGVEKELLFNLNAYANIEEHLGTSIPNAFKMVDSGSIKAIRAFIWAGLLHNDKNLSIEEVGSITSIEGLIDAISEAVEVSMPEQEENE